MKMQRLNNLATVHASERIARHSNMRRDARHLREYKGCSIESPVLALWGYPGLLRKHCPAAVLLQVCGPNHSGIRNCAAPERRRECEALPPKQLT